MAKLRLHELNRLDADAFRAAPKTSIVVVLDQVRSLHNVGSLFRTSDAFRLEGIHLCGLTAHPPHPEMEKTALGATEVVDWTPFPTAADSIRALQARGYRVFAVEQATNRTWLHRWSWPADAQGVAVVFGHEVRGVSEEAMALCDGVIEIPQLGTKHSLNVSVSAGIVLWELLKHRAELP
jgi:tRNA G18 (ribose-2'-O)-methylase SpoU